MKLNFKRLSAYALSTCMIIGSFFHTESSVTYAAEKTRVHVYQIINGESIDVGTCNSIKDAIKKADGTTQTVLELIDPVYEEMIEINKSNIILKSKDSKKPATLKGSEIHNGDKDTMIKISAPNVTVDSVNITGLWLVEGSKNTCPVGIRIKADNATINNCKIYDMGCKYTEDTTKYTGFNGHGIICSNDNYSSDNVSIKNPTVTNCELYGLILGNSEALVMNGNVTGFNISNNKVHNCDNIGIDIIGYEKSEDNYSDYDRARHGKVTNNIVYDISSGTNLTYRKSTSSKISACAGGIYVDGGYDVIIEGNYVENCDIGVELASEHGGQTTDSIKLINNTLVNNNKLGGISIGGSDEENGNATNLTITNNLVYNDAVGCFRIQKADDENNNISKNIFIAVGDAKTYLKEEQAGTNNIHDNFITKSSDKYPDSGDKKFKATDVDYNKENGTFNFKHEGYDLTGYGPEKKKETTSEEKKSDEPSSEEKKSDEPSSEEKKSDEPSSEEKKQNELSSEEKKSNEPSSEEKKSEQVTSENQIENKKPSTTAINEKTKDEKTQNNPSNNYDTTSKDVPLKKNIIVTDKKSNGKYKILKIKKKNGKVTGGSVEYTAPINKNSKKISVPNRVKINGVLFNVTAIGNNASKNNVKLKSVTIGKNVTKIGNNAFRGCKNLKKITIKSSKITKIGSGAFKGINNKASFTLPKKKVTKYNKMIKKAR